MKADTLSTLLPKQGDNNVWFQYNDSDTVVVFLHGILSDSRSCWLHDDEAHPDRSVFWPQLVTSDERLGNPSVYLAGYYTAVDAAAYDIRNCAEEVFRALERPGTDGRPGPMSKPTIVFVCHSTGGIVARYLLESNQARFIAKKVGLLLIASPSYGSKWADRLDLLTQLYNQQLGMQLEWGNWSLRDLDARFKNIVNQRRLPGLCGVEAFENKFVLHRRWLPSKKLVVTEESAGRYFGAPVLLRNTNHFTCVKPDNLNHPAHELLVDFWTGELSKPLSQPRVVLSSFSSDDLDARLEHTSCLRMVVMRSNSWFAARHDRLFQRLCAGTLEIEVLLPEPSNDNLMEQLQAMYDGQTPAGLAQSIRTVIARLLLMRAALPEERKDALRIATHEAYPLYSAYLFDDDELWYIPYQRKAGRLPVFVYSKPLAGITLYEDLRTLPGWFLTDEDAKRRLSAYVMGLFNALLPTRPSLQSMLNQLRHRGGKVLVFGGFVRDSIHAFVHREQVAPRDLDLVVERQDAVTSDGVKNHFGGTRWRAEDGLHVDCWDLASTLAFQRALVSPSIPENLPRTTVYRLNGCYLDLTTGTLHGEEAVADIFARRVAFNCRNYLDMFPEYQAFRAINLADRLNYSLDEEVKEFISKTLRAAGKPRFEQQVLEHRPDLDASVVGAYFDRYAPPKSVR